MFGFGNSSVIHSQDLDFLDSGFGDFDTDIIADPEHPKRFAHLFELKKLPDTDELYGESQGLKQTTVRDFVSVVSAMLLAVVIQNKLAQRVLIFQHPSPTKNFSIALLPPESIPEQEPADNTETTIELSKEVNEIEKSSITSEELPEQSETSSEEIEIGAESTDQNTLNLRDQIENIVKGLEVPEEMPLLEGLRAPGVVFDGHLRELLGSPEIERLNRWRAPTDAVWNNPGGRTLTKIGDLCFFSSVAAQGGNIVELPLIGNGWNLNYYRKVDCDEYFKEWTLERSDIVPAEDIIEEY